jgi:hypothetical protein
MAEKVNNGNTFNDTFEKITLEKNDVLILKGENWTEDQLQCIADVMHKKNLNNMVIMIADDSSIEKMPITGFYDMLKIVKDKIENGETDNGRSANNTGHTGVPEGTN